MLWLEHTSELVENFAKVLHSATACAPLSWAFRLANLAKLHFRGQTNTTVCMNSNPQHGILPLSRLLPDYSTLEFNLSLCPALGSTPRDLQHVAGNRSAQHAPVHTRVDANAP